jgi:hypothetical protein
MTLNKAEYTIIYIIRRFLIKRHEFAALSARLKVSPTLSKYNAKARIFAIAHDIK